MSKGKHSPHKRTEKSHTVFGLGLKSSPITAGGKAIPVAYCFGSAESAKKPIEVLGLWPWQSEQCVKKVGAWAEVAVEAGVAWVGILPIVKKRPGHGDQLTLSPYGNARDFGAILASRVIENGAPEVLVKTEGLSIDEKNGLYVGIHMGCYRYRRVRKADKVPPLPKFIFEGDALDEAHLLQESVNLARHLVNVPANDLNPGSFADVITSLFKDIPHTSVDVLKGERLKKERMGLLLAVGGAQPDGPRLVHIRYRPKSSKTKTAPIAFVGKGITFDSGGLNLKDSASMRLMKKDMGGAASIVGLAYWACSEGSINQPLDFYLAIAENSVSADAFRPGDVITARSGLQVEIDNTDAEGRLVLADALDYAVTQKGEHKPRAVINLATLTGAMRVALGTKVAGMFATDEDLSRDILKAAQDMGEAAWRIPLVSDYGSHLKSTVADMANSGPSRFGGAISAAVFLQKFVGDTPWVHVDLYAWSEGGSGIEEAGGNGQFVQTLAQWLS